MPRKSRIVTIGNLKIGGDNPIAVQSMCATRTTNIPATLSQIELLSAGGANLVRVAVDTPSDVAALRVIRDRTEANLSVDLQENYPLAQEIAPLVQKFRYNPGHLHHHKPEQPLREKVAWLAEVAAANDCAIRVGVNSGSVAPEMRERFDPSDRVNPAVVSAAEHCEILDALGFTNYCVSLKDSDPEVVLAANQLFAQQCPEVPLHLGVTEAGMPPEGILKSRYALLPLLAAGLGETIRVSLTVPASRKAEEIAAGEEIIHDAQDAQQVALAKQPLPKKQVEIISCPSCGRVENEQFVEVAFQLRDALQNYDGAPIKVAVMGCRVNGPGETDHADYGMWCGKNSAHLKRGEESLGMVPLTEAVEKLVAAIEE